MLAQPLGLARGNWYALKHQLAALTGDGEAEILATAVAEIEGAIGEVIDVTKGTAQRPADLLLGKASGDRFPGFDEAVITADPKANELAIAQGIKPLELVASVNEVSACS